VALAHPGCPTMAGGPQISSANPQICGLYICMIFGPSAIVAICRFAFCKPYILEICRFAICDPIIFADLKLPQIRKYIIFLLTNISLKQSHSNLRTTFGFWDCYIRYMTFRSLKYIYFFFFDPIFFLLIRKSIGGFYSNIIT
jgi:hypothetical protein